MACYKISEKENYRAYPFSNKEQFKFIVFKESLVKKYLLEFQNFCIDI